LPDAVVTVIVAVPVATGVTTPSVLTMATPVLLLDQVTFWFVAFDGVIVATRVSVAPPTAKVTLSWFRLTPFTATDAALIVTLHDAVLLPSAVVTVMVAVPAATGVTTPLLTVATLVLVLDQVTFVLVAFEGVIVATRVPADPPAAKVMLFWFRLTPVTATVVEFTVTLHTA
jgi:hypothetical protein